MATSLVDLRHPIYVSNQADWEKWRLAYEGGSRFLQRYLMRSSARELIEDFRRRKDSSYNPAFAKAGVNEVKNSIFQRLVDVSRDGGSRTYSDAMDGIKGGVDMEGNSMNMFMGQEILPELLVMARVGIYVDMPQMEESITKAGRGNKRPYLYWYKAEDILSWSTMNGSMGAPTEFTSLLLRDNEFKLDENYHLPCAETYRFRYLYIAPDGFVRVRFYDKEGEIIYPDTGSDNYEIQLKLRRIPFVMLKLKSSLMAEVADYQISLLNLCSANLSFAMKGLYPFYTEQVDFASFNPYSKAVNNYAAMTDPTATTVADARAHAEKEAQITLGASHGRRYAKGLERPGFIAPPTDPLIVSMQKEQQLKNEIRELIMLSVSNMTTQRQSADSKRADDDGLEAGLHYIGSELERAEERIAEFWADYEGSKIPATVTYPENYSMLSDEQRRKRATDLKELMTIPSQTYRCELAKEIAEVTIGSQVSREKMNKIRSEIDKTPAILGDSSMIEKDVVNGICDPDTAATIRGYPAGTAKKAEKAHAKRLATIALHQSKPGLSNDEGDPGARGVKDASANPQAGKEEKRASQKEHTADPSTKDRTRGTTK